jgi:hypothetical protein
MNDSLLVPAPYGDVRHQIRSGDLLLFRSGGRLLGKMIAAAGRSHYCHAAMAAWWDRRLMALEMVQFRGGRAVLLSNLVAAQPGRIDVYAANAVGGPFSRRKAVEAMKRIAGRPYGWKAVFCCGLWHMPLVRWWLRPDSRDWADGTPPFCSMAVARACRAGGVDPVPNLADRLTEPADLARSTFFKYRFTLMR